MTRETCVSSASTHCRKEQWWVAPTRKVRCVVAGAFPCPFLSLKHHQIQCAKSSLLRHSILMAWISELLAQIDSSMVTKPSPAVWQPSPKGAEPRAKGLLFLDSFFALELTNHRVISFHAASHRNRNRNHPTSSNFSQVSQRVVQLPLTQLRACDPARLSWAVTQPGSSRAQPQGILDVRNDGMNQSSSVNRADGRFPPLPVISKYPETSLKIPSRSHFDGTVRASVPCHW